MTIPKTTTESPRETAKSQDQDLTADTLREQHNPLPVVHFYPSPHKRKALRISKFMCQGLERNGQTGHLVANARKLLPGAAFFYGMDPYTLPLIREAEQSQKRRDWYYADNAYYFGRGEYFRITHRALMHDGCGNAGPDRFRAFGLDVDPWRRSGRYVLVTSQSKLFYEFRMGIDRNEWWRRVKAKVKQFTDREVLPCWKPEPRMMAQNQAHDSDFEKLLDRAWIVVTESSSTGVAAILKGIPVVSLGPSMCTVVATKIENIEDPFYPEFREQWLWNLAANQWTYEEMKNGTCWRQLQEQPEAWYGFETDAGMPIGL